MEAHTFLNIKILNNLRNESSSAKTKNSFFQSKALCDPLRPTPRDSPRRSALQAPLCARFYFGHNFSWSFLHYISLQNALPGQKVQAIEDPKVFALLSSLLFLSPPPLLKGGSIEDWSSLSWSACSLPLEDFIPTIFCYFPSLSLLVQDHKCSFPSMTRQDHSRILYMQCNN